jgi:hypothetical protein
MENSHRRIIAELEEKHRQEIEQLRLEKEQALAEETQATLAGREMGLVPLDVCLFLFKGF